MSAERIRAALSDAGFGIAAPLAAETYDALVPEAWRAARMLRGTRSVLVVANFGLTLWDRFQSAPEARLDADPLDTYTRRALRDAAEPDAAFALYNDKREESYLPLVALAQRAGLGSPGRIGVLLHPTYGPWISFRGVVYLRQIVPEEPPEPFDPCTGCAAPCADACHGAVVHPDGLDAERCYETRLALAACALRCDARRACVVGPEHAFSPEQEAHHARIRVPTQRPDRRTRP